MAAIPPILSIVSITSGTTVNMVPNTCYYLNYAGTVSMRLPLSSNLGDVLQVVTNYSDSQAWEISQNAGQYIAFPTQNTSVGYAGELLTSTNNTTMYMICIVPNTIWSILSSNGTFTFI